MYMYMCYTTSYHWLQVQAVAIGYEYLFSGSQDGCLISWSVADLTHVKIIEVAYVLKLV